jgi:hypothetical protein
MSLHRYINQGNYTSQVYCTHPRSTPTGTTNSALVSVMVFGRLDEPAVGECHT